MSMQFYVLALGHELIIRGEPRVQLSLEHHRLRALNRFAHIAAIVCIGESNLQTVFDRKPAIKVSNMRFRVALILLLHDELLHRVQHSEH